MPGPKTNERPGTRATLRGYHMSASKARVVLNLIRNEDVNTAREILVGTTREAADVIAKVLASAVANAVNNDAQSADELYVSAAFADEGITMKRFTPRARGRAGRIRKRACHITVIVSRLDDERLEVLRAARSAQAAASRSRRVASSRQRPATRRGRTDEAVDVDETPVDEVAVDEVEDNELDESATDEVETDETAVATDEVSADSGADDADDADEAVVVDEAPVESTHDAASTDADEETGK
jgi:large subunit ribosomal protein L22